jgi:hypothetical protein
MKKLSLVLLTICTLLAPMVSGESEAKKEDRLEIQGGAILTGIIEKSNEEVLWLKTDYAGTLQVEVARVERISSHRDIAKTLPKGVPFVDLNAVVAAKAPEMPAPKTPRATPAKNPQATPAKKPVPAKAPVAKKPAPAKKDEGWTLEAGVNMSGKKGNTEKFDLAFTVDVRLKQKFYRLDLYSRYSYGTNKGKLSSDEIIGGGRYTNFFFKNIGFFVREELEHDELEGLNIRSTSAAGLSWKAKSSKELNVEARSGISYRYDDYKLGGYKTFPGMDLGLDLLWKFSKWGEYKGSYTILPSFEHSDAFILEQDSGINLKLDYINNWSVRFGLWAKYNNLPPNNREKTDIRYYVRVISTWK